MTTSNRFNERYTEIAELLSRARESVPGQAQTFSKPGHSIHSVPRPCSLRRRTAEGFGMPTVMNSSIGRWRLGRCYWGTIIRPSTRPFAIGLILGSLLLPNIEELQLAEEVDRLVSLWRTREVR